MSCRWGRWDGREQPTQEAIDGILVLTVGTGSTWAMRATLVLAMSGLEWQEQVFDLEDARSLQRLKRVAPAGLVPWLDDGELRIHDSLAIAEYLHELCPGRHLYPADRAERALARSLCAELHAGFSPDPQSSALLSARRPRASRRWRPSASWRGCRPSGPQARGPSTWTRRAFWTPSMR